MRPHKIGWCKHRMVEFESIMKFTVKVFIYFRGFEYEWGRGPANSRELRAVKNHKRPWHRSQAELCSTERREWTCEGSATQWRSSRHWWGKSAVQQPDRPTFLRTRRGAIEWFLRVEKLLRNFVKRYNKYKAGGCRGYLFSLSHSKACFGMGHLSESTTCRSLQVYR